MAIRTVTIGTLVEEEGAATLQIDWDDAALLVATVRIANGHPTRTVRLTVRRANGSGNPRSLDGPPNQTVAVNVPTGQAARLPVTIDSRGRVDGVEHSFFWLT